MNAVYLVILIIGGSAALSWPLGRYLKWAMDSSPPTGGLRGRIERCFQRISGGSAAGRGTWRHYAGTLLVFNAMMFVLAGLVLCLQSVLPLNPDGRGALAADLIFNTLASFTTNTNLQHYAGDVSMSYFSQLFAMMWLQFVSAATGIAALTALARGLAGRSEFGSFLMDVQRAVFLVLLPMCLMLAVVYLLCGVPMTLQGAAHATTLEGAEQVIARGPVAAFLAIKQLGTNGGGFFGANSAHPFENPTFWTSVISSIAILVVPMACVWMFGRIIGRPRHAALIFVVMMVFLVSKGAGAIWFERSPTASFAGLPVAHSAGNLEGKELRFGAAAGPLWSALTTCTSNGSVNCMHDSLNPMTGVFPMIGMWLNSTFGGVGVGMINMFLYIVLAVFIAGMMVGRTPEYLNRRIEAREVKFAILALLAHAFFILAPTALFAVTQWGTQARANGGAHGFSEILYEFSSASANNGSGFEGLGDNTPAWNISTGVIMLFARFIPILLPLAIAGSLAAKRATAQSAGTLSVDGSAFALLLIAVIVIFGALTFFPAAALGPVAEHLQFVVLPSEV